MVIDWGQVVSGGLSSGVILILGSVRSRLKALEHSRAAFHADVTKSLGEMNSEIRTTGQAIHEIREKLPANDVRLQALEQEQQFQRGRMHELTNMLAGQEARFDERHSSLQRDLERLRMKIAGV